MIEKLGGRKFIISLLILLFSFILVLTNKLEVKAFFENASIILGIYGATNVISKFASK